MPRCLQRAVLRCKHVQPFTLQTRHADQFRLKCLSTINQAKLSRHNVNDLSRSIYTYTTFKSSSVRDIRYATQRGVQSHQIHTLTNNSISPPTSSSQHDSLVTFLQHAQRYTLSPTSTTYQDTLYEYLALEHLTSTFGFNLTRVGGRNDSGIDLLGSWNLPMVIESQNRNRNQNVSSPSSSSSRKSPGNPDSAPSSESEPEPEPAPTSNTHHPIPILIQCKRTSKPTPTLIRELEGSFLALPADLKRQDQHYQALAILICTRPATKGIRDAMSRSRRGLGWIMLEEMQQTAQDSETDADDEIGSEGQSTSSGFKQSVPRAKVRQFLWNRAADEYCGLQGLSVGLRYAGDGGDDGSEVNLLWQGSPLDFDTV